MHSSQSVLAGNHEGKDRAEELPKGRVYDLFLFTKRQKFIEKWRNHEKRPMVRHNSSRLHFSKAKWIARVSVSAAKVTENMSQEVTLWKFAGKKKIRNENKIAGRWDVKESDHGPSRKMAKLSKWSESGISNETTITTETSIAVSATPALTKALNRKEYVENFSASFSLKKAWTGTNTSLINHPFQVATVNNFVRDPLIISGLVAEMETMDWTRKQMDLYEFYQSTDLANLTTLNLAQFYKFLNVDVRSWMEQLTGMKFKKISASCSMYNCGDFLLTHDDLLSDRLIAFVYYLSPWKGKDAWTEAMGGALDLFGTDKDGQPKFPAIKKVLPANNQFVFFKVEKKSYHQVAEVLTKEYPRLTINGWFHGFSDNVDFDADAVKVKKPNVVTFKPPVEDGDALKHLRTFVNKTYLKDSIKASIQKQIEENSEAALGEFLKTDLHVDIAKELQSKTFKWTTKGPSNQQHYDCLNIDSVPKHSSLKLLLDLLASKVMFQLLFEYTELDLHGSKAKKPKCSIEVQRWKGGSYTLIGDPSTYSDDTLDLILYFGGNDSAGVITYLTPEEDSTADAASIATSENEDEPVLLTIFPQNNFLNIVYRSQGTAKFTKYCSKSAVMDSEFNYILFCSYKE